MSSLNTFGAIMTHAIDLETRLRDAWAIAGDNTRAAESEKRRVTLERVRRENVTEIKLEPIDGLDEADYALDLSAPSAAVMKSAAATAARFYVEVAPKINVREAQRALERCGKQHAEIASS
jgi:hypothetical protein